LIVYYRVDNATQTVKIAVSAKTNGWVGIGISKTPQTMIGSEAVIGWAGNETLIASYILGEKSIAGVTRNDQAIPLSDTSVCNNPAEPITIIKFTRSINAGQNKLDQGDNPNVVCAYGEKPELSYHGPEHHDAGRVDFFAKNGSDTYSGTHGGGRLAHGILMFIAWGIILQVGAIAARYCKHIPNALWFKVHMWSQLLGYFFVFVAFITIVVTVGSPAFQQSTGHGPLGLVLFIFVSIQVIAALFRPHPPRSGLPAEKTRRVWEVSHWWIGRGMLLYAVLVMYTGLAQYGAGVAVYVIFSIYLALILVAYIILERRLRQGLAPINYSSRPDLTDVDNYHQFKEERK